MLKISDWSLFFLLIGTFLETSLGWRWTTEDAIFQDVWPDANLQIAEKHKRASSSSSDPTLDKYVDQSETDDGLVFEGRYFKANEVPPPPLFMIANSNWESKPQRKPQKPKILPSPGHPSSVLKKLHAQKPYKGGRVPITPPKPQKFTAENAKSMVENSSTIVSDSSSDVASSNSRNILVSSLPIPLDELQYHEEELVEFEQTYKDSPKCFTPTDVPGRCIPFRNCFPVVFNVIDGDLRNPGLAKLLYQASGPCNASLELDFVLQKSHKQFFDAKFYNQSICCPGFKHPPTLLKAWTNDVRSARLIPSSSTKENSTTTVLTDQEINSEIDPNYVNNHDENDGVLDSVATESSVKNNGTAEGDNKNFSPSLSPERPPPVKENESSVELEDAVVNQDDHHHQPHQDEGIFLGFGEAEIDTDEENNFGEKEELHLNEYDVVKEPTPGKYNADTSIENNNNDSRLHDKVAVENMLRGGGDGAVRNKFIDPYLAVNAPNAAPNDNCQYQLHGMPRGHWPWMVALVLSSRHICSGALIDDKHVLTAAHCVFLLREPEIKKLRIIIGDRVMYSSVDGPHFWRKVGRVITHVNYNQQTFASDIAIIRMNSAVPFSRNVQPISLPDGGYYDSTNFRNAIVAGWSGADIGQPAFEARTETETVVDVMDKVACNEVYRGFALNGIARNTFCTKAANSTCVADSGAPLIVRIHNCWRIMGIMSWGIGCSHFPEVFTEVSRYVSWIRKHAN